MIGKMLGNRYEILEKLGGGGMAIVYKGRDTYLNRYVTIKVLRPEFTSDEDFISRFRREAQAVASLSHPNIVNIHDVGREDGVHYLVMEYVRGDNLKAIIKKNGRLSSAEAVRIAVQVCEALEHAHQNNIVHRDVKPHNILITHDGRAKLTDFGIAMEATSGTITRSDTIVGSVHYLSPEQVRGETATARSDIYAVGILLYEMLTGKQPYSGDTPIAVAMKHIQETPPPVDEVNPEVPLELAAVVMRAMEKRPEQRYASAGELARHLELALEDTGQATVVIPTGALDRDGITGEGEEEIDVSNKEKAPRVPRAWTVIAVLVLLAGLLAGGIYGFYNYMDVQAIKVPNVVGMNEEQARAELEAVGLQARTTEVYDEEEKGIVIAQEPGPDDPEVKPPRVINLTVSKGPELREVPQLYNLTVYDAELRLREAGLSLAQPVKKVYSEEVEKDKVVDQTPRAGKSVIKGTAVQVSVSEGPRPRMQTVPDLTGLTLDEARDALAKRNLELNEKELTWDYRAGFLWGQIIDQSPDPNTEAEEGTNVNVVLNNGPGPVERTAVVVIEDEIPNDGASHMVEIVVEDAEGRKVAYANSHTGGDRIEKTITYVGNGVVQVYIDKQLISEKKLK
ncbi:Stk1 family PASTA domain-containing Ser/Thr kinase [Desulfoscipio geothermicus]|uniref:non-specific serine/threonine protein kinase n=1 Tax=Desulfoscipio geothermicus DSM 3669 TaxID=1121426 RepID=A0A1I6DJE9_9FIRM|nr:Stk1 family PASTA domain-containing Ser/Thr kinase [Desulfoscipio geothermicus]SFR05472.1 serine/threonine protein kinase [Desulfoscipio geothermicus DSM 3669]